MKTTSIPLKFAIFLLSFFMFTSCAEKKTEKKVDSQEETISKESTTASYQCPMDCEDGKTYASEGSCPVCKMDLKAHDTGHASSCKKDKDGKCSCEGKKCKCKNCKHQATAMTCEQHKDGKCSCEGEKCSCANCAEHTS